MTENTVPRVAQFADLRVGMTIERVYTHPSGTTTTYVGVISEITERAAYDDAGLALAIDMDDDNPHVTLRILDDPTPKPLPVWGTLVRVIGGEFDGKRAVALERDAALCPWFSEDYGWTPATDITDWEIIHDPTDAADAPKADPLDESDHRDRIDRDGRRIERHHGLKHWHGEMATCHSHCKGNSLADWDAICGPLRFADEVTA